MNESHRLVPLLRAMAAVCARLDCLAQSMKEGLEACPDGELPAIALNAEALELFGGMFKAASDVKTIVRRDFRDVIGKCDCPSCAAEQGRVVDVKATPMPNVDFSGNA